MAKSLLDAFTDPDLLGTHFEPWSEWKNWAAVLRAIFGEPLDAAERVIFKRLFGYPYAAGKPASECLVLSGRGSGKTKISAALAVCVSALRDWSHLRRRARVLLIAVDREQASEAFSFVELFFQAPALAALIVSRTKSSLTLRNGIVVQIRTASARGLRGPSVVCAIVDEASFLPREPSANSDLKIFRSLRPATSKVVGSLLISISSTGSRDGVAYDLFTKYHGIPDAPVLVCRAKSTDLNCTKEHARARAAAFDLDPYSSRSEFDSEFFEDEATFVDRSRVTVGEDVNPSPPTQGKLYVGLDPSGGAERGDAFALVGAWLIDDRIHVGMVEARAGRKDPVETCTEFAMLLKAYKNRVQIVSDRFAAHYVPALFKRHGLTIFPPHKRSRLDGAGRMNQSDYFLALLGRLRQIDWPDHPALLKELYGLVRGPDGVSHPSTGHDDIIGAASRAIFMAGLALDRDTPAEPEDDAPDGEPEELIYGETRAEWDRRASGSVLKPEVDFDAPAPARGSMRERIERSVGNHYVYEGAGRFRNL